MCILGGIGIENVWIFNILRTGGVRRVESLSVKAVSLRGALSKRNDVIYKCDTTY
jgi:hypothetical protein